MKDALDRKVMAEFAVLIPKSYGYLIHYNDENKKSVLKWKLKIEDYKHYLEATQLEKKTATRKQHSWYG